MSSGSKPGLGVGIVEALAQQLNARVEISDATPGSVVTLSGLDITKVKQPSPEGDYPHNRRLTAV